MPARTAARLLSAAGLLAASLAWVSWIFLHTVGDPQRAATMATAVLDSPAARSELAADISRPFVAALSSAGATGVGGASPGGAPPGTASPGGTLPATSSAGGTSTGGALPVNPGTATALSAAGGGGALSAEEQAKLQTAIDGALGDPSVRANIVGALAGAQQLALGVSAVRPPPIDTGLLTEAVRGRLAPLDPALAQRLSAVPATTITLPTVKVPYVSKIRSAAVTWSWRLAVLAAAALAGALALGDRTGVLRRAGGWALAAGSSWALIPRLVSWATRRWEPAQASMINAVLHGALGPVTAVATTFVVAGLAAIVASLVGGSVAKLRP